MAMPSNFYRTSVAYSRPAEEIRNIFQQHRTSLLKMQQKAYQAIDDWSCDLIKQITDHAWEQKRLLRQTYESQQKRLDELRENFVASYIYVTKNDNNEIDRLLDKCKSLRVELVELNFPLRNTMFIKVIPVELPEQINQEESNTTKVREDQPNNNSIQRSTSESYPKPSSSSADRANPPSTDYSMSASGRSSNVNNNTNVSTNNVDNDTSMDKCPVCYMIFPANMSVNARQVHIDEHY